MRPKALTYKALGWLFLAFLFVVGMVIAIFHPKIGWSLSSGVVLLVAIHFRMIHEEERGLVEVFGEYYRTLKPGLRLLCPLIERIRSRIDIRVQRYPLFQEKPIWIDFKGGGSGRPLETFAYLQCDPGNSKAPYDMVYAVEDLPHAVISLIENVVRSVLNRFSVDEALVKGRGGFDITGKLSKGERDGIESQLKKWGLILIRITVGDFDLDEVTKDARNTVVIAEKDAAAAVWEARRLSQRTVGPLIHNIQTLADAQGLTSDQIEEMMKESHLREFVEDLLQRQMAIEGGSFVDIRVKGAEDPERVILNALAAWKRMPGSKAESDAGGASTEAGKEGKEKTGQNAPEPKSFWRAKKPMEKLHRWKRRR